MKKIAIVYIHSQNNQKRRCLKIQANQSLPRNKIESSYLSFPHAFVHVNPALSLYHLVHTVLILWYSWPFQILVKISTLLITRER